MDGMKEKRCAVHWLGRLEYQPAWALQQAWAEEIRRGERPESLLLLEHPPTFTFGRRGLAKHLLWGEEELAARGVAVYWVDRGGDVTYHGPGQLVGYPLLRLAVERITYLRRLEEALIAALLHFGVAARQIEGLTGVWVEREGAPAAKIAAIGVKVDASGITRHGFALNIDPEMSYWQGIVACGLEGRPATSLAELVQPVPSLAQVSQAVITAFGDQLGYDIQLEPSAEHLLAQSDQNR
jgi:lipoate-protein ligase B